MMKQVSRKDWVKALRSGKYRQAKSSLYDGEGYCCLGVACALAGVDFSLFPAETLMTSNFAVIGAEELYTQLNLTFEEARKLAGLNDRWASFKEIAYLIESDKIMDNED